MNIFNDNTYLYISDLIEDKIPILKQNKEFENEYLRLTDLIENIDKNIQETYKEQFNEMIELFYTTEKYYFALAYSLGVKYGEDLKEIQPKYINKT